MLVLESCLNLKAAGKNPQVTPPPPPILSNGWHPKIGHNFGWSVLGEGIEVFTHLKVSRGLYWLVLIIIYSHAWPDPPRGVY